jgi:hypothetical protein
MAAESERILIHYSKKKLTELKNEGTMNQMRTHRFSGKPNGFWYAYGEIWKQLINTGKAGLKKENASFKYEFRLPESAFVSTLADASLDTIFELSKSNLNEFMQHFVKEEHRISMSNDDLMEHAFTVMIQEGDSAILDELSDANPAFMKYYESLKNRLEEQFEDGVEINLKKVIKNINKKFPTLLSSFSSSRKALERDHLFLFNWRAFWKTVSESVGGVEFHEDLLEIDEWKDLHLTWTRPLEIHSGVIFRPSSFRNGILMEQLRMQMAGGMQTARGMQTAGGVQTARGKRYTHKKKSKRGTRKC